VNTKAECQEELEKSISRLQAIYAACTKTITISDTVFVVDK